MRGSESHQAAAVPHHQVQYCPAVFGRAHTEPSWNQEATMTVTITRSGLWQGLCPQS
ncbi:hypothetical protein FIBSPDRAFT_874618 [Athelia psychrophila]|uniref:Uncharacterized protein n=1 Tax=Athelia psychrophila TaxID=1759441 RepID=A0A165X9M2_9AGAM|nr:hypothetical protein FIBSPDRAFT_874618 [Fibularhizoctonia sp. CBS 109695]